MDDPSRFRIPNKELKEELTGRSAKSFPKYTSQLLNQANTWAGGTRPAIVGQMTELLKEFTLTQNTYEEWRKWYLRRKPEAIAQATTRIRKMLDNISQAIKLIDDELVRAWVDDLVIVKTFAGLRVQQAILSRLAKLNNATYRVATPAEESKGIDGYIGERPVSIKPSTYKQMSRLSESIKIPIVYYEKNKDGIEVDAKDFLKQAKLDA
jgi:hypothetical protein